MSLSNGIKDFKYLLDRNYNKNTALNLIVNHYKLGKEERNFLLRYVFSEKEIKKHRSKLCSIKDIKGKRVVIDGYNVLITVEAILAGKKVIRCMDGFVRDTSRIFSNYKFNKKTETAVKKILRILFRYKPKFILFVFDSQISKSGELAGYIRREIPMFNLNGDAKTSSSADSYITKRDWITFTSDSAIIERVKKVVDMGTELLSLRYSVKSGDL